MASRRVYGSTPFNAPGEFTGVSFTPDSRLLRALLTGETSTRLVSFDVARGKVVEQRELKDLWRVIHALPGGDVLLGWWGRISRLSAGGRKAWTLDGPQSFVLSAQSPDQSVFASIDQSQLWIREVRGAAVLHALRERDGDFRGVAFSPDGTLFATGASKGAVRLFDARTGREVAKRSGTKVLALAFSPTEKYLLVSYANGRVQLYDLEGLKPVSHFESSAMPEGRGTFGGRWAGFSPDGKRAFALGDKHLLRSWSVPDGDEGPAIRVPDRHRYSPATASSPDGQWIAMGSTAGALDVWAMADGASRGADAAPTSIRGLALTPRSVVAASSFTYVSWDRASGKRSELEADFPPTDVRGLSSGQVVRLDYDSIFVGRVLDPKAREAFELSTYASGPLALSRSEKLLAAPAQETVQLWELKRGLLQAELPHESAATACAFGPKDAWLVTADEALHLWRLGPSPVKIRDIPLSRDGGDAVVRGLAVSPRGWIAVSLDGSNHNTDAKCSLLVVDPRNGETVCRLERPEVRLGQVVFLGDTRIAVADSLGRLLLADVGNPERARWLEPRNEEVWPQPSEKETRPLAVRDGTVAYVGPDGSVVVEKPKAGRTERGAPFLLQEEAKSRGGRKAQGGVFEQRLAGTCFLFAGRFKSTGRAFREQTVKDLGGEVVARPDARVTHLVLGENATDRIVPALKARGATFTQLSEQVLMKLLLPTVAEANALLRNEVKRGSERWNTWRERYVEVRGEDFPVPLQRIDLGGLDLREYRLAVLDFTEGRLPKVGLSKVDLFDTIFRGADLREADLTGARCYRTVFTKANLNGARLGADLTGTCFDGADLQGADLREATLAYTDFRGADLRRARMPATWKELEHDTKTRWPRGFRP